jgi:anti-sigma factor RsiW
VAALVRYPVELTSLYSPPRARKDSEAGSFRFLARVQPAMISMLLPIASLNASISSSHEAIAVTDLDLSRRSHRTSRHRKDWEAPLTLVWLVVYSPPPFSHGFAISR